jgi:hypothetical protein
LNYSENDVCAVAVAGFLLLAIWKWPPLAVVLSVAVAGALLTLLA